MKQSILKYALIALCCTFIVSCASVVKETQKIDASMADYLGVPSLSIDCRGAIAQVDKDLSPDPVNLRKIEAVTKYADETSPDYKTCYGKMAWLYYSGKKIEGAIRTWIKKISDMAIIAP